MQAHKPIFSITCPFSSHSQISPRTYLFSFDSFSCYTFFVCSLFSKQKASIFHVALCLPSLWLYIWMCLSVSLVSLCIRLKIQFEPFTHATIDLKPIDTFTIKIYIVEIILDRLSNCECDGGGEGVSTETSACQMNMQYFIGTPAKMNEMLNISKKCWMEMICTDSVHHSNSPPRWQKPPPHNPRRMCTFFWLRISLRNYGSLAVETRSTRTTKWQLMQTQLPRGYTWHRASDKRWKKRQLEMKYRKERERKVYQRHYR